MDFSALGKAVGGIVERKMNDEKRNGSGMYAALKDGRTKGVRVITELKLSSPSKGELKAIEKKDIPRIIEEFESGGASAISVLIEPRRFNGSIEHLRIAAEATDLPLLAKGFLFTPMHLAEATAAGADAYLVMVRVLDAVGEKLEPFFELGNSLGMEAFIEANTHDEIARAIELSPKIIEVNNRDIYGDLSTKLENSAMGKNTPEGIAFVSASGVESAEDVRKVYALSGKRADAVLVGTSLMQADSIARKVEELVNAGKEAVL